MIQDQDGNILEERWRTLGGREIDVPVPSLRTLSGPTAQANGTDDEIFQTQVFSVTATVTHFLFEDGVLVCQSPGVGTAAFTTTNALSLTNHELQGESHSKTTSISGSVTITVWGIRPGVGTVTVVVDTVGCGFQVVDTASLTLGVFGPNGEYEPKLPCPPYPDGSDTGDPVLLHNGEEYFSRVDLAIPGRGQIHYELRRTYRSQQPLRSLLGEQWDYSYNERLAERPNGDLVYYDGATRRDLFVRQSDGSYRAPTGYFVRLIKEPDGGYAMRYAHGIVKEFRPDGWLVRCADQQGNELHILRDEDPVGRIRTIRDALGREISYFYDSLGLLERVVDFAGREVVYQRNEHGDLASARSPVVTGTPNGNDFPNGKLELYGYYVSSDPQIAHNLAVVIAPNQVADGTFTFRAFNTYGFSPGVREFDRVLTQEYGSVSSSPSVGGVLSYSYDTAGSHSRTTVTDRNANVTEYLFAPSQHVAEKRERTRGLRPSDPAAFVTRFGYTADGQLTSVELPEGNRVEYLFDQSNPERLAQGNLLRVTRVADPDRGGGASLVTTYEYEPLTQRVRAATGPRGSDPDFVPPLGTNAPGRYTATFTFDYQEQDTAVPDAVRFGIDLTGVPRGLGDQNGDGRSNQSAGLAVRVEAPAVLLRPDSNEAQRLGTTTQTIVKRIQHNDRGQPVRVIDAEGNRTVFAYFPENDPDGDGVLTQGGPLDPTTFGYLREVIVDAELGPGRRTAADPAALSTQYGYDLVGNVTAVTNGRGVRTEVTVNALNQPVEIRRAADVSEAVARGEPLAGQDFAYFVRLAYDANDNLQSVTLENRDGTRLVNGPTTTTRYRYDLLDDLVEVEEEISATETRVTRFAYDANQNRIRAVLPEGNVAAWAWDERDLLLSVTHGFGTPDASTIQRAYDLNGNVRSVLDAEDNTGDGRSEETLFVRDGFDRLVEVRDALGNRLLNAYDPASNLIRRRVLGHPAGLSPTDASGLGNVLLSDVAYLHDELGRVFEVQERILLPTGATARPIEVRDRKNDGVVISRFEFDALSRPTFVVEDDGDARQTVFDGAHRAIETIDALANRVVVSYDQASNPIRVRSIDVSPEGLVPGETFTTQYVWDSLDRLVRVTDSAGQTTRLRYDSRDNVVARSDPQGPLTQDPLGLFPGLINGPGNTRSYQYDGLDRLVAEITDLRQGGEGGALLDTSEPANPDGQITVGFVWDRNSRLVARRDDKGNTTSFSYDTLDRLVRQTNADGEVYAFGYDRDHNRRLVTDPNGTVQSWSFDGLNRRVRCDVTRALGVGGTTLRNYQYDGLSRLTRATDDNGSPSQTSVVERVYDSLSRLLEERQDGRAISSGWACRTKCFACTYPGGRRIEHNFDAINRVNATSDAAGLVVTASYVGPGYRELRREYGNGTSLSYLDSSGTQAAGYDAVQRVVGLRHLLPDGVSAFVNRAYTYNRASMRTSEQRLEDGGLTDVYRYDSAYRVVEAQLDQGGPANASRGASAYRYDGVGNRVETTRRTGGAASSLALHAAEAVEVGPAALVQGDLHSLGELGGRGHANASSVRLFSRSTIEGQVAGPTVELQPEARVEGDVETDALVARPGSTVSGSVTPYGPPEPLPTVDPIVPGSLDVIVRSRQTLTLAPGPYRHVTLRQGATLVLTGGTYEVEAFDVGQAATVSIMGPVRVRSRSALSFAPGARVAPAPGLQTADVRWETLARSVSVHHDVRLFGVVVAPAGAVRLGQDAEVTGTVHAARVDLVQHVSVTSPAAAGEGGRTELIAYQVNEVNEYTAVGGVPRSHDDNGNLLDDGARTFLYDVSNRLIAVFRKSDGAPVAAYRYDALGRRIDKVVFSGTQPGVVTAQTRFFYDGWRVCEEQDAAGVTLATYVYSPVYVDAPVQMLRTAAHPAGAGEVFFHQNARGDVVALTDGAGRVVERRTYDDFGRSFDESGQLVVGSAVGNPYGFQGRRLDPETRLLYFRARYYDPATGRFLQRDPASDALNAGNLYTYVGNSPVSMRDPSGREGEWEFFKGEVVGLVSAGVGAVKEVGGFLYDVESATIGQIHDVFASEQNQWMDTWTPSSGLGAAVAADQGGAAVAGIVTELPERMERTGQRTGELTAEGRYYEAGQAFGEGFLFEAAIWAHLGAGLAGKGIDIAKMSPAERAAYIREATRVGYKPGVGGEMLDRVIAAVRQRRAAPLRFGEGDLVYGPSAGGALRQLQEAAGGRLLTDVGGPCSGQSWAQFSIQTLESQLAAGGRIRFDLTHVQNLEGVLRETGPFADSVTAAELRYLQANWGRFQGNVNFYRGGAEVPAPW